MSLKYEPYSEQAYSSCMSVEHLWQVRACIGVVNNKLIYIYVYIYICMYLYV